MNMNCRKVTVMLVAIMLFAFIAGNLAYAAETGKKKFTIIARYGVKSKYERDYDFLAQPIIKTLEGETATVKVEDEVKKTFGFKVEVTPTIGENPELVIIKMKAWELRDVLEDGKIVKKYVLLSEREIKVMKDATSITDVRVPPDKDVRVTIQPNYN